MAVGDVDVLKSIALVALPEDGIGQALISGQLRGQRQRVAIGRAMVRDPKVFLMRL